MFGFYRALIFSQHKVIFAHGDYEYDGSDTFKAMNPFLALRSLASDVKHSDKANGMISFVHINDMYTEYRFVDVRAASFKYSLLSVDVDVCMYVAGYVCPNL